MRDIHLPDEDQLVSVVATRSFASRLIRFELHRNAVARFVTGQLLEAFRLDRRGEDEMMEERRHVASRTCPAACFRS